METTQKFELREFQYLYFKFLLAYLALYIRLTLQSVKLIGMIVKM